ncbi:hypothetical protein BD779DRAFT_741441 [Infundibulicybe gibba]|nr:hypothetical protein BD779DRAFT_741441 [Infundibulicybe gibba]
MRRHMGCTISMWSFAASYLPSSNCFTHQWIGVYIKAVMSFWGEIRSVARPGVRHGVWWTISCFLILLSSVPV